MYVDICGLCINRNNVCSIQFSTLNTDLIENQSSTTNADYFGVMVKILYLHGVEHNEVVKETNSAKNAAKLLIDLKNQLLNIFTEQRAYLGNVK